MKTEKRKEASADRVMTLHPAGKSGVSIDGEKYRVVRRALLACVPRRKEGALLSAVSEGVVDRVSGLEAMRGASVLWYVVTVKQDLEARGLIEIVPGSKPQRLRRGPGRSGKTGGGGDARGRGSGR